MGRLLPFLVCLAMGFAALGPLLGMSPLIRLLIGLLFLIAIVAMLVWQRSRFREALREKLLDAGIRAKFCFECGYDLEGYEGKECPVCDAPLLRQADFPPGGS
jgi:hypothetical protein